MKREKKAETINELVELLKNNSCVIFSNYQGLNAELTFNLRRHLKAQKSYFKVVKNTLLQKALKETGLVVPESILFNATALVYTNGDPVVAAKAVKEFYAQANLPTLKGGLLERAFIPPEKIETLAKLPGRQELLANLVGAMQAPLSGIVWVLQGVISNLVYTLSAIKDKKAQAA